MGRKVWSGFCLGRRETVKKRHLEGKKKVDQERNSGRRTRKL